MREVVKHREVTGWPELLDWFERGMPMRWPGGAAIRVEDYLEEGRYVLRAELPGVDPDQDVDVTVSDGALTIRAERKEEVKEGGRSEFRYGAFERSVTLPATAKEDDVTASYADGILTVSVGLGEEPTARPRKVEVRKD
ncbi:MAG TPA: Hsp20/alpha crystallin family protein [Jiangellales bacterium]|nr:Hsp20/alpha crystallin family protein [Jiangellales bacterium]